MRSIQNQKLSQTILNATRMIIAIKFKMERVCRLSTVLLVLLGSLLPAQALQRVSLHRKPVNVLTKGSRPYLSSLAGSHGSISLKEGDSVPLSNFLDAQVRDETGCLVRKMMHLVHLMLHGMVWSACLLMLVCLQLKAFHYSFAHSTTERLAWAPLSSASRSSLTQCVSGA